MNIIARVLGHSTLAPAERHYNRPFGFLATPGQVHDSQGFAPLLRMLAERVEAVLADKGYDADAIRKRGRQGGS